MTSILFHISGVSGVSGVAGKLLLAVAAALITLVPAAALAQPAAAAPATEPRADNLTPQDREVLAAAEQLANDGSQVLEQWITNQAINETRLFARLYFPIPKTDPQKYSTPYDALADRDLVITEDKILTRSPMLQYAIVTDINGYVPAHNARFAQPLTGNTAQDYVSNRTKRILGDFASLAAARNEAHYLFQRVKLETGDVIYEISVPVMVRGKHWGCARVGYRRAE
jgi:methyl-accepting chemotaxis protein